MWGFDVENAKILKKKGVFNLDKSYFGLDVDGFLENYLKFNDYQSVSFSYTEYNETLGYRVTTTIEKVREED